MTDEEVARRMIENVIVTRLGKHVTVKSYHQTVHSGAHCFEFTATTEQLRRMVRATDAIHAHVQVVLGDDGEIAYRGRLPIGGVRRLLARLEGSNDANAQDS